jgi:quinol monooxygenase YgiN
MAYVVTAKWTAREGEEERVLRAIKKLIEPSRAEPGNSFYQASRDPDDPRVF